MDIVARLLSKLGVAVGDYGLRDFKVLLLGDRGEVLCTIPITVRDGHAAIMRAATYGHDLGAADFEVVAQPSIEARIFGD